MLADVNLSSKLLKILKILINSLTQISKYLVKNNLSLIWFQSFVLDTYSYKDTGREKKLETKMFNNLTILFANFGKMRCLQRQVSIKRFERTV